ncbi:hypothetical protein D3C71_1561840 [compost metagenome]
MTSSLTCGARPFMNSIVFWSSPNSASTSTPNNAAPLYVGNVTNIDKAATPAPSIRMTRFIDPLPDSHARHTHIQPPAASRGGHAGQREEALVFFERWPHILQK